MGLAFIKLLLLVPALYVIVSVLLYNAEAALEHRRHVASRCSVYRQASNWAVLSGLALVCMCVAVML